MFLKVRTFMNELNYPRLSRQAAGEIINEYMTSSISKAQEAVDFNLDGAVFYPLAANRADNKVLSSARDAILEIAKRSGFPNTPTRQNELLFDKDLSLSIRSILPMSPAEASEESVWNFLTLRLIPDVAVWRWPRQETAETYERYIGMPRNILRRAWWAEYLLGPYAGRLGPEALVQILERSSVGFTPTLAQAVAVVFLEQTTSRAQDLLREAMKRVLRLGAQISLVSLSEDELQAELSEVFQSASDSLKDS